MANPSLARKNLMVDPEEIRALTRALGAASESEAVRIAIRDRLAMEEAQAAFASIRARGGLDDAFGRGSPRKGRRRAA
jgi:hypothetical protein